jgi:hypothetical protein
VDFDSASRVESTTAPSRLELSEVESSRVVATLPQLSEATEWGRLNVIEVLLGVGAHMDESMSHAIQTAARWGKAGIVKALIKAAGDPSATKSGQCGSTLRAAALGSRGNDDVVSMLINAGADIMVANGRTGAYLLRLRLCMQDGALLRNWLMQEQMWICQVRTMQVLHSTVWPRMGMRTCGADVD